MDLYSKNTHFMSKLKAKSQRTPTFVSGQDSSNLNFAVFIADSTTKKQPLNLFYSSIPKSSSDSGPQNLQSRPTAAEVHHNLDSSIVFVTTSSETNARDAPLGNNSHTECQIEEEDESDAPFGDVPNKKIKTDSNESIYVRSEQAQREKCTQTNVDGSHSKNSPPKNCQPRRRASFDEESDCSTACETHSDGRTTHEASEFSPLITFHPQPKFEEMRFDEESFYLDSTTCSDEDFSYMREAMEIASSYEGSCSSKQCSTSHSLLKFMCKLGHSFDLSLEDVKQKWCPRCHQNLRNIQEYASSFNGKVINRYYDEKIIFQCERNHIWTIISKNAKKRWCSQCLKDNKKAIKQQLEQERKQREMQAEEIQKQLFENARRQSMQGSKGSSKRGFMSNSNNSGLRKSMIDYFEKMEAEIEKVAQIKTAEYMASDVYKQECSQEQIVQVYKILAMPEEILKSYMFNLPLDCLRAEFRRLVKIIHPDKNKHPNAGSAFQRIHKIYESALGKFDASC